MTKDDRMSREEYTALLNRKKRNKYHARTASVNGIMFDSRKEADRYSELLLLQAAGVITDLRRQVPFELIPVQKDEGRITKSGRQLPGKTIERPCVYIADFVYRDVKSGEDVVEDVKGVRTQAYRIKRKLMLYRFGIRIREI